ncbi:Hypothetical protein J6898_00958 [Nakaseomyces glabratus]
MKYKKVFKTFILALTWSNAVAKTYENQEVVLDSTTSGSSTFEDDELMVLNNAKVTLKNYSSVKLPAGISLSGGSILTILTPGGQSVKNELLINGRVKIDSGSSLVYDGSKLTYASGPDAVTNYKFDINTGADGVYVSADSSMIVTLPALLKGVAVTDSARIHIGGTYQAPNNSPIQILGKLQVLSTGAKTSTYFTDRLWYLDLGPDKIDNTGTFSMPNNMSGDIDCECLIAIYGDIFKGTSNAVLHTLGYTGFVVVTPITVDLSKGPYKGTSDFIYNLVLPSGQDGFKIDGYLYHYDPSVPTARTIGLLYLYDTGDTVSLTSGIKGIQIKHTNPAKTITIKSDPSLNAGYFKGKADPIPNRYPVHVYASELIMILFEPITYTTITTTNVNEYTTEIIELIATAKPRGFPFNENTQTTITTTIYNQLREETKIIDLGNGVTEYQVLDYYLSSLNDINHPFGTSTKIVTYSPPPPSVTATTTDYYIESYWISFFITTDDQHRIITSSQTVSTLRLENDYTTTIDLGDGVFETDLISHITERNENGEPTNTVRTTIKLTFGPAPPPITKTVDIGNEVTEYLVVSYWTTTNKLGGLITTSSTRTYSAPPLTVTATTASDYVESDWISFFITVDEKGEIVTSSTLFNATRDYNLPEAPHTSFGPAPPVETHTVVLENNMTNYEVVSYWTTTNEFGGLITTSSTRTYSAPPLTVTATTASDYVESDWISFFITVDEKGEIVTSSTLFNATRDYNLPEAPHTSFGPAPPVETHTVVLENNMTNYEVVSYWTTTNEFGGLITTSSTRTYSAPPLTVTATTASDYVESDWISFFITVDEKGEIVTSSTLFNATRDYNLPEAPHTSFGPAPPVETHTVVLENNMTNYEVVSYWTTTNEFGGLITTSSTRTYSAPPLTVTATTASDYVESDWISFFITVDEKGEIVTSSTLFNATRDYNLPEAPHTSFGPAPPVETHTVVLENNMTNYEVVSYWTTTNEFGGLITTSSTRTYSAPPLTVTATTASDYVESDWISFFITVDEKGEIVTSSTLFNATRDYNLPEAPHTSFGPAPPVETHTVVLENNMTNYEVVSYWTTTNEFGGLITTSSTRTYSAPPLTVTATTASDYVESDWISFFITVDEKGEIVTSSTLFNATRDYNLPEAPHTSFGPAPPVETHTVVLENNMTNYEVVSYWTTTNEFGGLITTSSTRTYSAPPLTVTATTASDYVESDWISFFITVDEKGEIVTSSTLFNATRDYNLPEAPHTSFGPAPPVETHTVVLENNMTNYEVVSYWTTTNEFGGLITTSSTRTYSAPPLTVTATTASDYVENDWISFFITVDEKGEIVTSSTLFNATRDYNLPEAPHTSFGPAPPVETHTVVLENNMTNYEVVSYWTTTNEFGGLITTSSTRTYSAPPLTVTATTASDYVESDWISFFITVDEKGEIVTSSTLFNATRDYNLPEAPHTSFGPAPPVETHTVVLENNMTNYEVVSYWTTTNEFGGLITTSSTRTYSAPPLTVTANTASDYVESDWISFFITVDEKGEIVTSSTLFNATRDYNLPEAPHTSFGPAPPVETHTVVLENNMTNYEVVSYWTTTNEFGGLITTSSTRTYSAPPLTVTATTASDYVESDWISFFITVDEKGEIVTSSTLFNATRDYNLPEAPHTSFGPAPPVETHTVVLENNMTNYEVVSYWTTTNEFGGLITTSSTRTYSAPPLTVTATTASDYVESDWISFFITVDEKGEIVTSSTLFNATRDYNLPEAPHTSFGPAPPVETHTVVLENNMTNYEVVSYWTTTNEFGGLITTSSTRTYSAPPLTVTATTASDYVESDWISFFITVDEKGEIVTSSTLFNATRDYNLPEAPHTSFGPAPPVETHTVVLENNMTNYEVVSYWTTTNEFGGLITTSSTRTYSAPPLTVTATTASDYVESDWISFFITVDEKGEIVTSSTLFNATRDYNLPEAPHTSFGPAPPVETHTVVLENNMTNYEVVSYWTTTNEFGGLITTSSTRTYSAPPLTVTATTASDYVESDWISFFITVDEKGEIVTSSTLFNATRDYNLPEAPHTSFGPAPPVETHTVVLENNMTNYEVVSYWTTTNEFGGLITTSSTRTYSAPPLTVTATTASDYVESDWISFFITVDEKGEIVTSSTLFNATRDYNLPEAPHTSFGPAPPVETHTVVLENNMTNYEVVSYWTTTNEFGGLITTSSTRTYSAPPLTVTATTASDYVESDWISFFITVDEKGEIVTSSTLFNATRDYNLPEAPHTSFGPAPPVETHTVVLENNMTNYEVVSYWTTTNEFGGLITTSSTRTYSAPPLTVTATTASDYVESDWISFFITVDEKGEIVTSSTLFNATRDYNLPEAPHTSFGPAPPVETHTVVLENNMTNYEVVSYWTTTNEFGGLITTSSTRTYSAPPLTVTATTASDYVESDWISFFITVDEKGEIVTSSTLFNATRDYNLPEAPHTSFGPAPPVETHTVVLENNMTNYEVVSYWTTTNEFGGLITTSSTRTYSAPPLTVTATTASDYVESDWISFFITVDEKGEIVTSSTLFNATRDYNLPEAPHTSFGPAPPVETHTVVLENNMTNYEVVSYWTTTNEFGGLITTSSTRTYSAPPLTVTATTASDYVESDWISFFITVDEKGEIVTSSTLFNATRDYNLPEAPHTSFGPAPPVETHTVVLENNMTNYEVVSYWTTTNEFGGLITTSSTRTYSAPPLTVTATTASDYVESDWISFFITVDEKGEIVTSSTLFNATRDYNLPEAPHTSFGPAPPVETHTVVLENNMTNYEVVSYWTTTNEFGGLITTSSTRTYSAPPLTVTATTASDYVESDWISFFITVDEKGEIVTSSTLFNATRDYNLPEAPHTSFGPAPPVETHTVVLENNMTNYEVVSYWTTTNEFGGLITTSSTRTYSAPPLTVTATTASDYVESDWISFFITVDEKGEIVTSSTLFNATRDYNLPEAPHTSFGPAPPVETHTVVLENNMTNYEVVSYWTTTNEFGGLITTSSTRTYSAPPLTVTATTASDYVESDWISFFITVDEKGEIVTSSTLFNATRDYNLPEAPHTSFGPAPPVETHTVVLENNMTNYEVVSYWTTTNEFGGLITTSSTRTYSAPPLTVTATTASDYVESDWISFFITVDEKGEIVTSSTLFNATRVYIDAEALYLSSDELADPISREADYTTTIDKGNGEFETDVVSHITTKDSDGKPTTIVTTIPWKPSEEADYTTTIDKGNGEFETDVVSHITTKDSDGKPTTIVTTIPWKPSEEADYTTTIDKGNGEFETDVVSHITTKDSDGKPTTIVTTIPWKPSEEADYTTTIDKGNGEFETDVVSHITTKDSDGKPTTIVTTIPWKPSEEADYTTTIDKGNGEFETDVVSHITTKDSDGKPTTIVTTIPWKPSEEADYTTTIDKGNGEFETDVVSHITTKDSDGKPTTIVTTIPWKPSEEADYTTTIDKGNGEFETDVVSHITTKDSDGKPTTIVTTIPWKPSEEADYTTTIDKGNGEFETDVVSHITTKDSDGKPTTIVTTIPWKPSEEADYTTTIDKGNGEFETDVVSHITTKDSDGKPTTIVTTIPWKPSEEADYTTTIDKGNGEFETDVVSHITTKDSDGKPTTIVTTIPWKPSEEADYTTTIDKGNGEFETDVVSHITTKDSDGKPTTIVTTIPWKPSEEADYTTTIDKGNGEFETDVVSHITTKDSDGKPTTIVTTIPWKPSEEADYTTTIDKGNGEFETDVVSHITTKDSDGKPTTIVTTIPWKPSEEADYTTTIDKGNGEFETDVVSHITTKDSDGKPTTIVTTIPWKPSEEADYTTTIDKGNGEFETDVVSHITTKDSDGKPTTIVTTIPWKPSEEADYTTTIDKGNGEFETDVVSHITTKDSDGKPTTIVTTIPWKPSEEADYTTTIDKGNGEFETDVVSHITTKDSDGKPTTIVTTIPWKPSEEADYTTTIDKGNGEFETDVVSHITTKDSDGKPTTIVTTIPWKPSEEADYTTTIDKGNGEFETDVVSHITTKDSDGKPTTIVTTIPWKPSEEADYTTTIDKGNGEFETDVVSHITTKDSDGKPTTIVTTIPWKPSEEADYTTTIDKGNGEFETDVVSHITTKDSDGKPTTIVTTIPWKPSEEADYTTTIDKGNGEFETDVVSHITTKDSDGKPTTIVTTIPWKPSEEADYTTTIDKGNGEFETDVVSHITTKDSDGKPTTIVTTIPWKPSEEADYTTTIDKGNGEFETDVVSHITTKDSDGKPTTIVTTIPWKPSEEADYTTTIDKGNGEFETDVVSHITTKDSDGKPTTIVTTIPWKPSEEADYTTTIDKGNGEFETDVVSHITTKDSDGKPTTIVTTIPWKPSEEADYTTTIDKGNGEFETDVVSHITTKDSDGKPTTIVTTIPWKPSEEADYTTTIDKGNGEFETDVVSHITTKDSDGKPTTIVTTIPWKPSEEADYTTTIDKGNGEFETDVVSHITTKDSDGKPTTIVTTIPWKPSEEADYTTTIDKGNGEFETDVVSHITTKDSDGKPTTIVTTIPWKPSEEADYTTTIDKGNGEFETDVVSHITTKDSDGKPTTIVTTIPWKPSEEADYTTTIDKGNGEFETDVVSHITTKDSDGKPTTIVTTIPWKPSEEADYTTTIDKGNGEFETDVVSHITTKDSDGKPTTIVTTIPWKPSEEADYTTTIDKGNGEFETDVVSHITTKDSDGKPTTIVTTIPWKPSEEADYTTTIDKGNGEFETDVVSHITTKDSDGKPTTIVTTIPWKPSEEADYTTTIDIDGHTVVVVVSHITTMGSNGDIIISSVTAMSFDRVDDGAVYTSAPAYSQPSASTTTVSHNTTTATVVVSFFPSEGEDGVTRTGTTTISTITASGEADYTTTIDKGNGDFETELVSHITTKDSDGNPTTIITTVTLTEEPDYTSVFISDGHTITAVVSHVTTTNDIGQTVTTTVTVMSYDQVGEGVYTSAPAYSQPPVTTTTVSAENTTATVVISYFPSVGDDGVTRTGTTTISTVSVGGEADYTTTVDRGSGSIETDVISHITTTDSNSNPTTITTTIINPPAPSNPGANVGSDYTTTVVSDGHTFTEVVSHSTGADEHGHTIVSTVTQIVGGQSNGSTVPSAAPVLTVSGAGSTAPGTAGVGGIVNSQKPQSGNVAGQGSGNENPTQAAGTAGGSDFGTASVHQSAGNNVPSGSLSVQSPMDTASPVSGIHGSQTPNSVPSQAQQQGQGQGQAPSSRQQVATTVLSPSDSSVNNDGSGFSSTQTASALQGSAATIKAASNTVILLLIILFFSGLLT